MLIFGVISDKIFFLPEFLNYEAFKLRFQKIFVKNFRNLFVWFKPYCICILMPYWGLIFSWLSFLRSNDRFGVKLYFFLIVIFITIDMLGCNPWKCFSCQTVNLKWYIVYSCFKYLEFAFQNAKTQLRNRVFDIPQWNVFVRKYFNIYNIYIGIFTYFCIKFWIMGTSPLVINLNI
jgi:hypothetical protein